MDVPVSLLPEAVLVVHEVVADAAVGGQSPTIRQVLDEGLLESGVGGEVSVGRVVGGDRPESMRDAVGADAVAEVKPGRIGSVVSGLRTVFGDGIAGEIAAARSEFGCPADHGDGQHGLRAAVLAVGHEAVRAVRRYG